MHGGKKICFSKFKNKISELRIYISQYWDYHNDLWCFKKNLFFKSFYSSKNPRKIGFHNIENDTIFFSCTKSAL